MIPACKIPWNTTIGFLSKYKQINWTKNLEDFFPESLGRKRGCLLYMAQYGKSNSVGRENEEI